MSNAFHEHCQRGYVHQVNPKDVYRRTALYEAMCKCGFTCKAYGKRIVESQLQGHIKTMIFLEERDK